MSEYSGEDLKLISGLFTRVGFYISHADDTDLDDHSEELELKRMAKALERIEKRSPDFTVSECAKMARLNIRTPEDEMEDKLTGDIKKVVGLFTSQNDQAGYEQFRKALMYVGTSVARAYREELDHHEDEFLFETMLNKITGYLNRESDSAEFANQNISPAEDSALTAISEALRIQE